MLEMFKYLADLAKQGIHFSIEDNSVGVIVRMYKDAYGINRVFTEHEIDMCQSSSLIQSDLDTMIKELNKATNDSEFTHMLGNGQLPDNPNGCSYFKFIKDIMERDTGALVFFRTTDDDLRIDAYLDRGSNIEHKGTVISVEKLNTGDGEKSKDLIYKETEHICKLVMKLAELREDYETHPAMLPLSLLEYNLLINNTPRNIASFPVIKDIINEPRKDGVYVDIHKSSTNNDVVVSVSFGWADCEQCIKDFCEAPYISPIERISQVVDNVVEEVVDIVEKESDN